MLDLGGFGSEVWDLVRAVSQKKAPRRAHPKESKTGRGLVTKMVTTSLGGTLRHSYTKGLGPRNWQLFRSLYYPNLGKSSGLKP